MRRAEYKVAGGKLIKVKLTERNGRIAQLKITGDFFLHPEELIDELEQSLVGNVLDESELTKGIRMTIHKKGATLLGVSPEDFAKCIILAGEKNG